jgi:beta-galactosidase
VIASVVDENDNVKRLFNGHIRFQIEGEGEIIDDGKILANPREVEWGTAPVLVRSTTTPGEITLTASMMYEGIATPGSGEITFNSVQPDIPLLYSETNRGAVPQNVTEESQNRKTEMELRKEVERLNRELNRMKIKDVAKQQSDFEGVKK